MQIHDPHSYASPEQGTINHIDFCLSVDFAARTIQVAAHYHLDRQITGSFFLDTRSVEIERIHTDGIDVAWEQDRSDPILGERLHLQGLDRVADFTIELTTAADATALQWLTAEQTAGGQHPFLYSQCQALHARSIFPCQDTPSVRFTYTAEVEVPVPLVALMAAAAVGRSSEGQVNRYRFEMAQPIPSYLFALAAGDIAFRELGPRCGIYAEPEVLEAAAWEFGENEAKLREAEEILGPYVWDRYDLLIMPPSFPYGGMENPRLTFLSPVFIVGDRSMTDIVTHELAHAWTGNLVTNAT